MKYSRRNFLKSTLGGSLIALSTSNELFALTTPLQTLKVVQTDLFPKEKIDDANAYAYLSIILHHSHISDEDKHFLKNGTLWLNEEALKTYKDVYIKLSSKQRQKVLRTISQESWGKSWIKTVLGYIMEAVLGDPIYGINKEESGWKWLAHTSGLPRPTKALL